MKKHKAHNKILIILLLLAILTVGVSIAYLTSRSDISNQFTLGSVDAEIVENFDGNVKSDVKIRNTGKASAYVRCKIAVYYEVNNGDEDSISTRTPVEGTDYRLSFAEDFDANWFEADGIYYYKKPVNSGEETAVLIKECKELAKKANENLVVDISVQAIQSTPEKAVTDAWKKVVVDPTTKELKEGTANGS